MSAEALSSFPPQARVGLVDLAETESSEASRAFVTLATRHATEVGGRRVIANEVLVPMTIPDAETAEREKATRLLVVSEYPTPDACLTALARRKESMRSDSALPRERIRSYAAQPWSKVQATLARAIMTARGFFGRTRVPRLDGRDGDQTLESLVRGSAIHDELPEIGIEDARWSELAQLAGDRPIWMLNFLGFRPTAIYPGPEAEVADGSETSGARAYARYGQGMFRPITRVGGHVAWNTRSVEVLPDTRDVDWDQIAIAYYPSPAAMLTMLGDPDYKAAHVHREAGLARTRLVATQPLDLDADHPRATDEARSL